MAEDFNGSVAQEDVQFITGITKTAKVGENFSNLVVYCEESRYIEDITEFVDLDAAGDFKMAILTKDSYKSVVKGRLESWLDNYFSAQGSYPAYVVTFCPDITTDADWEVTQATLLETAFGLTKQKGAYKTVLVGSTVATNATLPAPAVVLAGLCSADETLSMPAYFPCTTPLSFATDPLYMALTAVDADAFMVAHHNVDVNGALLALSLSLSVLNASSTPVGNNTDFVSTGLIGASGPGNTPLSATIQAGLKEAKIAYFKPIGDGTGNVTLFGASTLREKVIPAIWIVKYVNYLSKCYVANYITRMNTFRNARTYAGILSILNARINLFTEQGSGRLSGYVLTAPKFSDLPVEGTTIVVPNAWTATYVDNVRKVQVYGDLTILG